MDLGMSTRGYDEDEASPRMNGGPDYENTAVAKKIRTIEQVLGTLEKRQSVLTERLRPVRRIVPRPQLAEDPGPSEHASPLVAVLEEFGRRLQQLEGRMGDLMGELEL